MRLLQTQDLSDCHQSTRTHGHLQGFHAHPAIGFSNLCKVAELRDMLRCRGLTTCVRVWVERVSSVLLYEEELLATAFFLQRLARKQLQRLTIVRAE